VAAVLLKSETALEMGASELEYLYDLLHTAAYPDEYHDLNWNQWYKEAVLKHFQQLLDLSIKPPIPFRVGKFKITFIEE
jgi:hypothetical protein